MPTINRRPRRRRWASSRGRLYPDIDYEKSLALMGGARAVQPASEGPDERRCQGHGSGDDRGRQAVPEPRPGSTLW